MHQLPNVVLHGHTPHLLLTVSSLKAKLWKMVGACKINQYSKINICMTVTIIAWD